MWTDQAAVHCPPITIHSHTTLVFHRPRRKLTALTTASDENATVKAMNTPLGPQPSTWAMI